jgi:effector-binding domain-containing protein
MSESHIPERHFRKTEIFGIGQSSPARILSPKLETRRTANLAYIEHMGPYDKIPWEDYMKRLYGWAKEQKVMPGFYPMATYYDDMERTPPGKCRSDISITFKGRAKEQAGLKIRRMPAMKVATISHKGPGSEFKNTYAKLTEWIGKRGYQISGPPMEIYSKKPEVVEGVTILYAKVMIPVKKN